MARLKHPETSVVGGHFTSPESQSDDHLGRLLDVGSVVPRMASAIGGGSPMVALRVYPVECD